MRSILHYLLALTLLAGIRLSYAQCVPDSLVPSVPGIYPKLLPDAQGCEPYSVDITFYLPRDTTATILPGQTITVPFNYFRIDTVVGLPAGMTWSCNLQPDCEYDVAPGNPSPDTLGCIRIQGTPTTPATYRIVVYVTANVALLGNQIGTYEVPLTVKPCIFTGDCYAYNISQPCEPSVLQVENLVPSLGNSGFSYQWNFSGPNGFHFQSIDENPWDLPLPAAGTYYLNYEATVDTIGWFLTDARIEQVNCSDLLDPADLYWKLVDSNDSVWYNTVAAPITNGGGQLPLMTNLPDFLLPNGLYQFQVWDKDQVGGDQGCGGNGNGALFFSIPQNGDSLTIQSNGLRATMFFSHPVQAISCADTFEVNALPQVPVIAALEDTFEICQGDTLHLFIPPADSVQWFRYGKWITFAGEPELAVFEAGDYHVEVIDPVTYCRVASLPFEVVVNETPAPNILLGVNQQFQVVNPKLSYAYTWYEVQDGLVGTGKAFTPTKSGNYYATAIDLFTGCESIPSPVVGMVLAGLEDMGGSLLKFSIGPNPAEEVLEISWELQTTTSLQLSLTDASGRVVKNITTNGNGSGSLNWDVSDLAGGIYHFSLSSDKGILHRKIVIH